MPDCGEPSWIGRQGDRDLMHTVKSSGAEMMSSWYFKFIVLPWSFNERLAATPCAITVIEQVMLVVNSCKVFVQYI